MLGSRRLIKNLTKDTFQSIMKSKKKKLLPPGCPSTIHADDHVGNRDSNFKA